MTFYSQFRFKERELSLHDSIICIESNDALMVFKACHLFNTLAMRNAPALRVQSGRDINPSA
jgi:hypothetical protein